MNASQALNVFSFGSIIFIWNAYVLLVCMQLLMNKSVYCFTSNHLMSLKMSLKQIKENFYLKEIRTLTY